MANLQATGLADLVATTLNELGENKFTDMMSDYQDTVALKRLMKKNKTTFKAGTEIQFNAMVDHNHSARYVPLGAPDIVDINNVMITGKIPWRHMTWNFAIERREIAMNRAPRQIVDLVKTRRLAALGSAIIKFEEQFWKTPSVDDDLLPYGIPTYIVKSNTAASAANADGFNGSVPSGWTNVANINPTTYPRWKNYATQYTAVTKDDLIRKWRRASVKTNFKPLIDGMPTYNTGDDYLFATNYSVMGPLEESLEAQNDNLGNDIASKDGMVMFKRAPVLYVKELELDTTNPVYGINFGELSCVGLLGEWMHETQIAVDSERHTMSTTHTDCTYNMQCRNRRRQFVLATDTTLPA